MSESLTGNLVHFNTRLQPFYNARIMFAILKMKSNPWYDRLAILFYGAFLLARFIPMPYFWRLIYEAHQNPNYEFLPILVKIDMLACCFVLG